MTIAKSFIPIKPDNLWEARPFVIFCSIYLALRIGLNKCFLSFVEEIYLNEGSTDDKMLQISLFSLDEHIIYLASGCYDGDVAKWTSCCL